MVLELYERYAPLTTAPRHARRDIAEYLESHDHAALVPVAVLLVSELVTNAVVHADGAIALRARLLPASLHVDVDDGSSHLPQQRIPSQGGRGLHIVDALATEWGVVLRDGVGKSTWFELRLA